MKTKKKAVSARPKSKPKLSIARPPETTLTPAQVAEAALATLPDGTKAPARFQIEFIPDQSGLKLAHVVGTFVFRYPKDKFSGGAERVKINLDEASMKYLQGFYDVSVAAFCKKHGTLSVEETLKLPLPPVDPQAVQFTP